MFIVCVGNIAMGGTGKSPIVRNLAAFFLSKGHPVAIASRGMGGSKHPVYASSQQLHQEAHHSHTYLSDENREHFELLLAQFPKDLFFILQNKKRRDSLLYLKNIAPAAIVILDDGLQHFDCPRDINICVWQPDLLRNAPPYCFPLGPYREGFGARSMQGLLNHFDYRFWSRTTKQNEILFQEGIALSLKKFSHTPNSCDVSVCYEFRMVNIVINTQQNDYTFEDMATPQVNNNSQKIGIACGIAHPQGFLNDLKAVLPKTVSYDCLFLSDHSPVTKKLEIFIENHNIIILTLKDFFRWISNENTRELLKSKTLWGCLVNVDFQIPLPLLEKSLCIEKT